MIRSIAALFAILSGCNTMETTSIQNNSQQQVPTIHQQSPAEMKGEFQSVLSGSAETEDGIPFSFNSYKSSDGTMVSTRFQRCNSSACAKKELIKSIRTATKVIERTPKLGKDSKQVGERAVFTSKQEGSDYLQTTVIWTNGSQVYFIESRSLQHALEFEKWYLHNL